MKYVDKSIRYYLNKLAEKTPAPGGGSVAALLGASGCGLLSMVAKYTIAKKSFNGYKERAKRVLVRSEKVRKKLIDLIDKDIVAYERLSSALSKSKTNTAKLEFAFKRAVTPPAKVCYYVHKGATFCLELAYVGTKTLIADVIVAIYVLDAAFESALVNIKLNLSHIKDRNYVIEKTQLHIQLQQDIKRLKNEILSKSEQRMLD